MTQKRRSKSEAAKTKENTRELTDDPSITQTKSTTKRTKKQLEKALQEAIMQSEKFKGQLAYLQANHENYVKTMGRQEEHLKLQANRDLILNLLPVLDDLERAQLLVPQIKANEPFINGLQMVVENLKTLLMNAGLKPIDSEGKPFDPLRHEAVIREETSKFPPRTVMEELRKGYLLKGALLRPSMVKIAVAPTSPQEKRENSSSNDK